MKFEPLLKDKTFYIGDYCTNRYTNHCDCCAKNDHYFTNAIGTNQYELFRVHRNGGECTIEFVCRMLQGRDFKKLKGFKHLRPQRRTVTYLNMVDVCVNSLDMYAIRDCFFGYRLSMIYASKMRARRALQYNLDLFYVVKAIVKKYVGYDYYDISCYISQHVIGVIPELHDREVITSPDDMSHKVIDTSPLADDYRLQHDTLRNYVYGMKYFYKSMDIQGMYKGWITCSIHAVYYDMITSGVKTHEGRLYRDKWRKVKKGTHILFKCKERKPLYVTVLYVDVVMDMYNAVKHYHTGLLPGSDPVSAIAIYRRIYSDDDISDNHFVAMKIAVITL